MAGIPPAVTQRQILDAKRPLLRRLVLLRFGQKLLVFDPLDAGAIEPLDGTLDLDGGPDEDRCRPANFQRYFLFFEIVLDERTVRHVDVRSVAFDDAAFRVAGFPVWGLRGRTQFRGSVDGVVLGHHLFTFDFTYFFTPSARFRAPRPIGQLPFDGAIQHVAVLAVRRRRLRTHVVGNDQRVATPLSHFVYAVHLPGLYADPATLRARREVRIVPSGRTGVVVAGPGQNLRFYFHGAQIGRGDLLIVISHTIDDQLLDAAQTRGAAMGVTLLLPGVGFAGGAPGHLDVGAEGVVFDVIDSDAFVRTGLHEALFGFDWLGAGALFIGEFGDGARELQEDFAMDLALADAFAAGNAARGPFVRDESGRRRFCWFPNRAKLF